MKATPLKGQNATLRGHSAAEIEQGMSDAALIEGKRRYPFHTDKQMARDADCSLDAMKTARKRGKLRLRYVLRLAWTWGPDAAQTILEPLGETLAEAARIEARSKNELSQELHHKEGSKTNT